MIGHTGIRQQQQGTRSGPKLTRPFSTNCLLVEQNTYQDYTWSMKLQALTQRFGSGKPISPRICQAQGIFQNGGGQMRILSASYTTKATAHSSIANSATYAPKEVAGGTTRPSRAQSCTLTVYCFMASLFKILFIHEYCDIWNTYLSAQ